MGGRTDLILSIWGCPLNPFRILNSSTGIPSPPLVMCKVMLPKAHLTSHSRMSRSRWVITQSWLSGHEDLFCTVLLCILAILSLYLLLLLCAYHFCPLLSPSFHEMFPWYLIFLKRSLVFPILLFSSISLHWSLRKAFLNLLAILWNFAFKWVYLSFFAFHFASFHSFLGLAI